MSNYIEGNKNTVFDTVNRTEEMYELLEETLDDIAANAYNKFDKDSMKYAQETLDKIEEMKNESN